MANQLGTIGERFELIIRRGATTGPFVASMKYADGSVYDLTGHTIRGHVSKRANQQVVAPITAAILDATAGTYTFELTDEDSLLVAADPNPLAPSPAHYWVLEMVLPGGQPAAPVIPLYWGDAPCWRG